MKCFLENINLSPSWDWGRTAVQTLSPTLPAFESIIFCSPPRVLICPSLVTANSVWGNDSDTPGRTVKPVCATEAPTRGGAGVRTTLTPAGLSLIYPRAMPINILIFFLSLNSFCWESWIQFHSGYFNLWQLSTFHMLALNHHISLNSTFCEVFSFACLPSQMFTKVFLLKHTWEFLYCKPGT